MISSFFSKAKPIHLLVVSAMLLVVFVSAKISSITEVFSLELFFKQAFLFGVCLASLFVLDFFVSKNNLTKKNSYKILMFGLFVAILPETLLNSKLLIANLFVLLALRRLISLRSGKEIKKKLFDAAFWISLATLLFFWASLFYILILMALLLYAIIDIKNWIVPILGILCIVVIAASYMIAFDIDFQPYLHNFFDMSFDFTPLNSKRIIIAATLLLSYGTWASFYYLKNIKHQLKRYRPSFIIVIISSLIALVIILVSPNKNGSEFIFLIAPLAIIMSNYLEIIPEKWFKESLIIVLILVSILNLLL
ncbi:hypothetical protein LX77_01930 [Gelidibacter algens]|jgi:hypothetical protein|uniref:Beta-carotene 15,15'-monooxygenase n=1 Tax=Gelidibacter algens TaxID=49280 RepID=A0A1A7QVS9_9FLAO|nr:DUF6427 family protein [Gelidibacter algens]OBX22627.1 hypothetical protein A9996_16800 [Gelidibacter algens]RAJ24378.1 hypothetical protein LX77_01930 [Gelidibacter algens]